MVTENILVYIRPSAELFRPFPEFEISTGFEQEHGAGHA